MVVLAAARRELRRAPLFATLAVLVAVTAGTLSLRSGDLGFLKSWFGPEPDTPGQYAASWSQRLIYAYVGGRVFLDQPLLGTGWYGELPAEEYARYLPDARERFSDQPPHYFPTADGTFIPQQTYDQMLYELGLVGVALLLVLLALAVRKAVAAALQWPRGPTGEHAYLPAAWLAAVARRARRRRAVRRNADRRYLLADAGGRRGGRLARPSRLQVNAPPKLTIVHVIARLNVGGAALHVLQLAREQQRRGHDVVVVAGTLAAGEESMEYVADELGVDRARRSRRSSASSRRGATPRRSARCAGSCANATPRRPPHAHGEGRRDRAARGAHRRPGPTARRRPHLPRPRPQRLLQPRRERVFRLVERLLGRATGALVAVSDEVRDDLVRFGVAPAERFTVVPYGFDLPAWSDADDAARARVRTELGIGDETFVVGWAGRLTAIKRPLDLVRTLRALLDLGVDAQLVVVGDGEDRPAVEALAAELGVTDRCRLVGFQQGMREWYAAFDATLLTSANEGTPVVAIESLAAERPVVATRAGGTSTVVLDGESGFLESIGDIEALAGRLAELARDGERRAALGRRGAEDVRERFATGRMADELEAVYRRVLER